MNDIIVTFMLKMVLCKLLTHSMNSIFNEQALLKQGGCRETVAFISTQSPRTKKRWLKRRKDGWKDRKWNKSK